MILYNVTVIIDEAIQAEWLHWIEDQHIPDIMATGMFVSSRLLKVLDSPNEGITYCMQFIAETQEKYDQYKNHFVDALRAEHAVKFEGKFVHFSTLMEFIEAR